MPKTKPPQYSLDNINSVGAFSYTYAKTLFLPRVLQALLSSGDTKKMQSFSSSGTVTTSIEEINALIVAAGGKCVVQKKESTFITSIYVWPDSYLGVGYTKKTKAIEISGWVLDPKLMELKAVLDKDHVTKSKVNLVYSIIKTQSGLEIRSMGDGSSELIPDNYTEEVIKNVDYIVESFKKAAPPGRIAILNGEPGCHRKGQKLLMFDGTIKLVEDIVVGDWLMGPDSEPREVISLCRGHEEMVQILPIKGEPWVVNRNHILSLVRSGSKKDGLITDISIPDWINCNIGNQQKQKLFKVSIDFNKKSQLSIDPYIIGVLLGDGSLHEKTISVASLDEEIVDSLKIEAKKFGLSVHRRQYEDKCPTYSICFDDGGKRRKNPFTTIIKNMGLNVICENKFIPKEYKLASRKDRLELLAGLLDTDGHLDRSNTFDFVNKSKTLVDDVAFLARSLGFAAYPKETVKSDQFGTEGIYYRMSISGNTDSIPTKIKRKIAGKRKQIKNVLRTGFSIKHLPSEDYYGFTLTGDGRYLLDDFTVTHNTGKTHLIRSILKRLDCVFLIVPSNMIESLDKPEFIPLLLNVKNEHEKPMILIIEDGDTCLVPRKNDNISTVTSLLNLSDGILGSVIDIKMIISTNAQINNMDAAILRPGRLCSRLDVGLLPYDHANRVYQRLMKDELIKLPYRKFYSLAEVYDKFNRVESPSPQAVIEVANKSSIGFNWSPLPSENIQSPILNTKDKDEKNS